MGQGSQKILLDIPARYQWKNRMGSVDRHPFNHVLSTMGTISANWQSEKLVAQKFYLVKMLRQHLKD